MDSSSLEAFRALENAFAIKQEENESERAARKHRHSHNHNHTHSNSHSHSNSHGEGGRKRARRTPSSARADAGIEDDADSNVDGATVPPTTTINVALGDTATSGAQEGDAEYENVPFFLVQRDVTECEKECFGCDYGFGMAQMHHEYPELQKLWDYYNGAIGHVSFLALAKGLRAMFETYVREPRLAAGHVDVPDWSTHMILTHIKHHVRNQKTQLLLAVDRSNAIVEELANAVFRVNKATGEREINDVAAKHLLQFENQRFRLLQTAPDKLVAFANASAYEQQY